MEISKTFSINTDYKDRRSNPQWETHSFAEVVFIDKTGSEAAPMLYLFKDPKQTLDSLQLIAPFHPSEDTFVLIGEVSSIDRRHKKVLLANQNSIAYNYLVVASGNKPVHTFLTHEFASGLQALIDALRVKPKIPSSFAQNLKSPISKNPTKSTKSSLPDPLNEVSEINHVAHPSLNSANSRDFDLNAINRRLYEVQL